MLWDLSVTLDRKSEFVDTVQTGASGFFPIFSKLVPYNPDKFRKFEVGCTIRIRTVNVSEEIIRISILQRMTS